MKPFDEIAKEVFYNHGRSWVFERNQEVIKEVAIAYASQAIDECADKAYKRSGEFINNDMGNQILKLKSQLQ